MNQIKFILYLFSFALQIVLWGSLVQAIPHKELGRSNSVNVDFANAYGDRHYYEVDESDPFWGTPRSRGFSKRGANADFANYCANDKSLYLKACVSLTAEIAEAVLAKDPLCGGRVTRDHLMCVFEQENIHTADDRGYIVRTSEGGAKGLGQFTEDGISTLRDGFRKFGLYPFWQEFIHATGINNERLVTKGVSKQLSASNRDASIGMSALHLCTQIHRNPSLDDKKLFKGYNGDTKTKTVVDPKTKKKKKVQVMEAYSEAANNCYADSQEQDPGVVKHRYRAGWIENESIAQSDCYYRDTRKCRRGRAHHFVMPIEPGGLNPYRGEEGKITCKSDGSVEANNAEGGSYDSLVDDDYGTYGLGYRGKLRSRNGRSRGIDPGSMLLKRACAYVAANSNLDGDSNPLSDRNLGFFGGALGQYRDDYRRRSHYDDYGRLLTRAEVNGRAGTRRSRAGEMEYNSVSQEESRKVDRSNSNLDMNQLASLVAQKMMQLNWPQQSMSQPNMSQANVGQQASLPSQLNQLSQINLTNQNSSNPTLPQPQQQPVVNNDSANSVIVIGSDKSERKVSK